MSKKNDEQQEVPEIDTSAAVDETAIEQPETDECDKEEKELTPEETIAQLEAEIEQQKKEYLFLMAEFDNYRKRTLKEKADLIKNGGEKAMLELLPVIDDFERALDALDKADDVESLREGVGLIYDKFVKYLEKQQVKAMSSTGAEFDSDFFDAVTSFPAPDESQKGKVIDTVLKGYTINDKVLRHAKVVVGQ